MVDALLEAPPALKLDDAVQASFLARRRPSFLGIVNANTGTSIGAGPARRRIATFRRRALGKLRVPGYQPYERLGLWLRRELRATVERILLDRRCLDRGVFEPETVRRILDDHTARRANHTYLLVSMMIFEIGQRMIVDGDLPEDQRGRRPEPAPSSAR
jgi:asparagine synthase (glutamine-hydrolysing)